MDTIEHVFAVLRAAILAGEISPKETVKYLDRLQAAIPADIGTVLPELDEDIANRFEHVIHGVGPHKLRALQQLRGALAYANEQGLLDDARDFVGAGVIRNFVERINDQGMGEELRIYGEDDGNQRMRDL